jgi:hypothetical protein
MIAIYESARKRASPSRFLLAEAAQQLVAPLRPPELEQERGSEVKATHADMTYAIEIRSIRSRQRSAARTGRR